MLQTPYASSKKSAPTTPVKPIPAALPLSPVTLRTTAPGESSETTDISGSEENSPAVVRLVNIEYLLYLSLWQRKNIIQGDI